MKLVCLSRRYIYSVHCFLNLQFHRTLDSRLHDWLFIGYPGACFHSSNITDNPLVDSLTRQRRICRTNESTNQSTSTSRSMPRKARGIEAIRTDQSCKPWSSIPSIGPRAPDRSNADGPGRGLPRLGGEGECVDGPRPSHGRAH